MSEEVPYRDELAAAHQRIEALERELAELKGEPRAAPREVRAHLAAGEELLWSATLSRRGRHPSRRGLLIPLVLGICFSAAYVVLLLRGLPPALLLGGGLVWLINAVGLGVAWSRRQRTRYESVALTDARLLRLGKRGGAVSLESFPLSELLPPTLLLREGGEGDLLLGHRSRGEQTILVGIPDIRHLDVALRRALSSPPSGHAEPSA